MVNGATDSAYFTSSEHPGAAHDAVLHTLDRVVGKAYFSAEAFEQTLDAWSKVPLIYVPPGVDHPEFDAWEKNPKAELERIRGRVIDGAFKDVRIERTGHPRLIGTGVFNDKEIESLIENGKLSLSIAFWSTHKDGKLVGPVQPHHVLLFEETLRDLPNDKGSGFLSKEGSMSDEAEAIKIIDRLKALVAGRSQGDKREEDMSDNKELESRLAIAEKGLADANKAIAQLQTEKAQMGEAVKAKDTEIAGFKQKEKDVKWAGFKAKHVPPGMIAGDKESAVRKEFEEDPLSLMEKVLEFREKHQDAEADGEDGREFVTQKGKPKEKKYEDQMREVGIPCISVRDGKEAN